MNKKDKQRLCIKSPAVYGYRAVNERTIREPCKYSDKIDLLIDVSDSIDRDRTLLMSFPSHWTDQDIEAAIIMSHRVYKEGFEAGRVDLQGELKELLGVND